MRSALRAGEVVPVLRLVLPSPFAVCLARPTELGFCPTPSILPPGRCFRCSRSEESEGSFPRFLSLGR